MIVGIYKEKGPSSNKVLTQIKKLIGIKKVGHAGTLDPLASGVLVVAIGRESTKQLDTIVQKEKEYIADIFLGANSTTDDEEGEKTIFEVKETPTLEKVKKIISYFIGIIEQTPPIYSAIKISGLEAYKLARKGREVEMKSRPAEIKEIDVLSYDYPILKIRVVTGKGVYIRSLARDIGEKLKTGGYIKELERIRVGEFTKEKAIKVENVPEMM